MLGTHFFGIADQGAIDSRSDCLLTHQRDCVSSHVYVLGTHFFGIADQGALIVAVIAYLPTNEIV